MKTQNHCLQPQKGRYFLTTASVASCERTGYGIRERVALQSAALCNLHEMPSDRGDRQLRCSRALTQASQSSHTFFIRESMEKHLHLLLQMRQTGRSQWALTSVYQMCNFWSCTWYVLFVITLFHRDELIECTSKSGWKNWGFCWGWCQNNGALSSSDAFTYSSFGLT